MTFNRKLKVDNIALDLSKTNLKEVVELCSAPEKYVLVAKYWLITGEERSLQSIGDEFGMTRERIRQILAKSLNKVRRLVLLKPEINDVFQEAQEIIAQSHGIISEENLINTLRETTAAELTYSELKLLLSSDFNIYYMSRNKYFKKSFYIDPVFEDLLNEIVLFTKNYFDNKQSSEEVNIFVSKLKKTFSDRFVRNTSLRSYLSDPSFYENTLRVSRDMYFFDGKLGLGSFEDVNPKTIKLKLKHVLRKVLKPMHYEKLTKQVEKVFEIENVKISTVHNELVKNNEIFVNTGMGMYGLKEWGIQWGNTIDIIQRIFKKTKRPMKIKEIVKEVLKEKMVREVTILMVLQKNKDIFQRVGKWIYEIKA